MRRELAKGLLSRIAVDVERTSSILVCDRDQLRFGDGIAAGAWGLALGLGELARVDDIPRWRALARRLAAIECGGSGAGMFGGPEGQWAAYDAAGMSFEIEEAPPTPIGPGGDLMDGGAGIAWAHRCRGEVGIRASIPAPDGAGMLAGRPGLGHGELGIAAAYGGAHDGVAIARLLDLKDDLTQAGWCNGIAGVAVAALLADEISAGRQHLELAGEVVHELLAMPRPETDGLCHGVMGMLVVAAGVARLSGDPEMEAMVGSAADAACRRSKREGWRLEASRVADQSWLTGTAGIAWALLALDSRPIVNPLCPADSVLGERARRESGPRAG